MVSMSAAQAELADIFSDASQVYPQTLVGVVPAMGAKMMTAFTEGTMGYDDFLDAQLEGEALDNVVRRTVELHEQVGYHSNARLPDILPGVYNLAKASTVSAVYDLSRQDVTKARDKIKSDETGEEADAVRTALFGPDSERFRRATASLFAVATRALFRPFAPGTELAEKYRNALLGTPSEQFPQAGQQTTKQKKEALTAQLRPIVLRPVEKEALAHGFTPLRAQVFVHNITRPG